MAQETYGKDQHQQEQPCPGQPETPSLLQQTLGGKGVGAVVRRERGQPSHIRGSGGSRDRWGRNVIQAQPGCAKTGMQNSVWVGEGWCWHLAGCVTGDDILVITAAFPQQLLVGKLEGFNGFLQRLLCLEGERHLG